MRSLNRNVITRLREGLHIETVRDLLFHLPARYEEVGSITPIKHLAPKESARILGIVTNIKQGYTSRGPVASATVEDPTGRIPVTWFNQKWVAERLHVGDKILLTGKLTEGKSRNYFANPTYEIVGRAEPGARKLVSKEAYEPPEIYELIGLRANELGFTPLISVYPETEGVTSRWLNFLAREALERVGDIPSAIASLSSPEDDKLIPLTQALRSAHTPQTFAEATAAQERIQLEELLPIQCAVLRARYRIARDRAPAIPLDAERVKQFLETLPFTLTDSQRTAAFEIMRDMERERPMHRLLVGDVGSGKTLVAALAALNTAHASGKNKYQTALMAPTEILATQHFEALAVQLRPQKVRIGLLTGSGARVTPKNTSERWMKISKVKLHKEIAEGTIDVLVGTHALVAAPKSLRRNTLKPQGALRFKNLGLAIVDEQHRFGVNQRASLAKLQDQLAAGSGTRQRPHFLTMTATPIPRSLALTIFGDLDLSFMRELPKGRQPIETKLISNRQRATAYDLIRSEVADGQQAYVICPLVSESEKVQAKAAEEEYERLQKEIFPDLRLGLLHGQMKAPEKAAAMKDFVKGKIDVLVATSVVEVGIDVPNATVIAIEGAERFGLAQLYQMRGRVGRGTEKSYCLLFTDHAGTTARARLKKLVAATSGSEVAQADLEIRGPGELAGVRQAGLPDVAMRSLGNVELLTRVREIAKTLLKEDPGLRKHPALAHRVHSVEQSLHLS